MIGSLLYFALYTAQASLKASKALLHLGRSSTLSIKKILESKTLVIKNNNN